MLTAVLSTVLLVPLLQDAAPAAADAPANDPKAVALVEAFEARLYDPVAAGLETLSFDFDLVNPMMGSSMGMLSVQWKKETGIEASFELDPSMAAMIPADQRPLVEGQMKETAKQFLAYQLNSVIAQILDESTVQLETVDGALHVKCTPRPDASPTVSEATLVFDEEGTLASIIQKAQGPTGAPMEQAVSMHWRPVTEGSEALVLDHTSGGEGFMKTDMNFTYTDVGGLHLVTSMLMTSGSSPDPVELHFSKLVANGTAVPDAAPEPAAAAPAEGGR